LYNSLNGKHLEYSLHENEKVYNLITQLNEDTNLFMVGLSKDIIKSPEITTFIDNLKITFIGDVVYTNPNRQKPVQIKPIFNIQKDIKTIIDAEKTFVGSKMMQELSEVTVFINDYCSLNCDNCQSAYKQFTHCTKAIGQQAEMNLKIIERILDDLRSSTLNTVKISGGNILKYSNLEKLCDLFEIYRITPEFYIYYENILNETEEVFLRLVTKNMTFNVLINNSIDIQSIKKIINLIAIEKITFTYIITEMSDVEKGYRLMKDLNIDNYVFLPYYNRHNHSFFQKKVFINKKDIFAGKPSISEIYARQVINTFSFGKLQIMRNGDVYANLNEKMVGNITKQSLHEIAYREITESTNWRKTRNCVSPCNKCLYKYLCPPISNYEYNIGKFNLCKIVKHE
jgi:pseudo-rSAM protein